MKNIFWSLCLGVCLCGCEDFLDTENFTQKNTGNFPQSVEDVNAMLTGAYAIQNTSNDVVKNHPYFVSEAASDERLGGCGENSTDVQSLDKLMTPNPNNFEPIWLNRYQGIYRVNMLLETIDRCKDFKTEDEKNKIMGEAYFLRALYYWDLVQLFETVPLTIKTEPQNLPRATVEEMYAQMGSDMIKAIELMPSVKYDMTEPGRATRWAAEGYLSRIFLFYTGFYQKESMPLNDGKTLTKADMIAYLDDCIKNSGHDLVGDFRNLWAYSNSHTAKDWQWAIDNNLKWEGDSNKEVMYAYKYAKIGSNGTTQMYKNFFMLWQGLPTRINIMKTFPYAGGWALGSVCPQIWDEWKAAEPTDIRRQGSIIDLDAEAPAYRAEGFDSWEETMYRAKKFMPVSAYDDKGNLKCSFTVLEWGVPNIMGRAYITDFPLLRFADILLMHSELSQTTTGINRVRNRAGLPPIGAYSLEALQKERRWELSFEGVRWNDIRRWHIAEELLDKQSGVTVYNRGFETKMPALGGGYSSRYRATNGGFWAIPQSQIDLSNGVLTQNKGWEEGDNFEYTGWH